MLSIFRGLLRQRTFSQLRQASFVVRDIFNERSDETGTLLNRFSKHVAIEGGRVAPLIPHTIRYADYFPVVEMNNFNQQLSRTTADQIPTLLMYAFTYRPSADPVKFVQVLNAVDEAAVRHLPEMDTATILRTLYAWLFLMPNWIMRTDFYHASLEKITLNADSEKEQFMQVCFYLGLSKKTNTANKLSHVLTEYLERYLPDLNAMDLAIIANAAFKTSTEVKCAAFNAKLEEQILLLTLSNENIALLITFLKSMRLQRISSANVCEHISQLCIAEGVLNQLEPRALSHILALFAENLWDQPSSTKQLIAEFMTRINKSPMEAQYTEIVRPKDMATFLWANAHLGSTFTESQLQEIETCLLGMVHAYEFEHFPDQLVDSCLCLWMLGLQSKELLRAAIIAKKEFGSNRLKPKVESRLTVLLSAAAIQQPNWNIEKLSTTAFKLKAEVPAYLKKNRPDVVKCTQQLAEFEDIAAVNIARPINGINILSMHITLKDIDEATKSDIFLELLTENQTLKFSKMPVGLMRLRIALLKSLGYKTLSYPSNLATADIAKLHDAILSSVKNNEPVVEQEKSMQSI